jgi:hypothetical protein
MNSFNSSLVTTLAGAEVPRKGFGVGNATSKENTLPPKEAQSHPPEDSFGSVNNNLEIISLYASMVQ